MELDVRMANEARTGTTKRSDKAESPPNARPRARAKRPMNREEFTYRLHLLMLYSAGTIVGLGALGHALQPADKLWEWMIVSGVGVLLGKFSNRVGQSTLPPKPGDEDEGRADE